MNNLFEQEARLICWYEEDIIVLLCHRYAVAFGYSLNASKEYLYSKAKQF